MRVNEESLMAQLQHVGRLEDAELPYFKALLDGKLPLSYGGGLGISRIIMELLRTGHIGEVQVGVWHDAHLKQAATAGIDMIPNRIIQRRKRHHHHPKEN
jgi:aspartate--ammonia ligase